MTLFERDEAAGGLVRFGVPDFKIEKTVVQRRVEQLIAEGVELRCGVEVGRDVTVEELRGSFDAVVLATGSRMPRDLPVPGRELDGVHFAMDYLYQRNRWVAREFGPRRPAPAARSRPSPSPLSAQEITAKGKDVVVIGGGDTGADCVGNALREGARSIVQLELLPEPPPKRPDDRTPWPEWPQKYRLSYAMEEAKQLDLGEQDYSIATVRFEDDGAGAVASLRIAQAEPAAPVRAGGGHREGAAGAARAARDGLPAPEQALLDQLGVEKDGRGNVKAVKPYTTSVDGVFAAGDARRGQSLIVWAINEGRQCARMVDRYLAGKLNGGGASVEELPAGRRLGRARRRGRGPRGPAAARRARDRSRIAQPSVAGSSRTAGSGAPRLNGVPTFCRHNRFIERCPICSKTLAGSAPAEKSATKPRRAADERRSRAAAPPAAARRRQGGARQARESRRGRRLSLGAASRAARVRRRRGAGTGDRLRPRSSAGARGGAARSVRRGSRAGRGGHRAGDVDRAS